MIELPEATTIARQMTAELRGKRIGQGDRGNAPHKFAFYSRSPEEYAQILKDRTLGEATANGWLILAAVEPDYALVLGCGGERILYHRTPASVPAKRQLLLRFSDETSLTVTVQGWGAALLLHRSEVPGHRFVNLAKPSPLSDAFTPEYFLGLFAGLSRDDRASLKYFMISEPGVLGVGNGCLQDILWRAGLHPRRPAGGLAEREKGCLYAATRQTLREMVEAGGRDTDRDLLNRPGGYRCILSSRAVGQPCPRCRTPIEKASYLGGAVYFCPDCQPLPGR